MQPTNPIKTAAFAFAAYAFVVGSSAGATYATVGTYDSTSNTNTVDRNASGNALVSADRNDVAGFTPLVSTAFAAGLGGVINFDTSTASGDSSPLSGTYDSGAKGLNIAVSQPYSVISSGNVSPISGSNSLIFPSDSLATNAASFTFSLSGATLANEAVTQIGFTLISRRSGDPTTATVVTTFSDNSTSTAPTISFTAPGTSNPNPAEDTFYGFTAPAGLSISKLDISFSGGDGRRTIDDFGFITAVVPEPSTALLGALGSLCLLRRRR